MYPGNTGPNDNLSILWVKLMNPCFTFSINFSCKRFLSNSYLYSFFQLKKEIFYFYIKIIDNITNGKSDRDPIFWERILTRNCKGTT